MDLASPQDRNTGAHSRPLEPSIHNASRCYGIEACKRVARHLTYYQSPRKKKKKQEKKRVKKKEEGKPPIVARRGRKSFPSAGTNVQDFRVFTRAKPGWRCRWSSIRRPASCPRYPMGRPDFADTKSSTCNGPRMLQVVPGLFLPAGKEQAGTRGEREKDQDSLWGHSDPTNEATEYHVRISDFPEQPHFSYKLDCQDQASTGVAPQPKRREKTQSTLQVILIPEKYLSPSGGFPNRVSDRARSRPKEVPQLRSSFLPHTMPSAYGGGGG